MKPVADLVTTLLAATQNGSPFAVGVVATVTAGGATDGNALVTVTWMGTDFPATYGAHYTPVVGHTVLLARTQPLSILMRLIGTPPNDV